MRVLFLIEQPLYYENIEIFVERSARTKDAACWLARNYAEAVENCPWLPDAVVLGQAWWADAPRIAAHYRRRGVPVVMLEHGAAFVQYDLNPEYHFFDHGNYDYLFTWCRWSTEIWRRYHIPEEKLIETGLPRWDRLSDDEYIFQADQKLLLSGICPEKKLVVYLGSHGPLVERFIEDLQVLPEILTEDYQFVYKPHPAGRSLVENRPNIVNCRGLSEDCLLPLLRRGHVFILTLSSTLCPLFCLLKHAVVVKNYQHPIYAAANPGFQEAFSRLEGSCYIKGDEPWTMDILQYRRDPARLQRTRDDYIGGFPDSTTRFLEALQAVAGR